MAPAGISYSCPCRCCTQTRKASFGVPNPTTHQLSQVSAILNPEDTNQFETLISDLMSLENDKRSKAETLFNLCKQHNPSALVSKLCDLLPVSSQRNRAMCADLLRLILTVDSSSGGGRIYTHLSGNTQSALHKTLIERVYDETDKSVLKKVCDTVSELAAIVLPRNCWLTLLDYYMFKWVFSVNDRHRESALLIFAQLVQYIGGLLVPHLERLHQAFLECLDSGMVADVRIAAFTASINFIRYLEEASDRDKFHDLIPLMMQVLNEALVWNESTPRESMLKLLIEWAGTETFVYEGVVEALLQTAEAENLEEGTKHLALKFVVTLVEAREEAPGMIKELPHQLVKRLFVVLMKMLSDVKDDPNWYNAEIEHEDAGETNNYIVGQEYLDRLSISLGGNTIVHVFSEIFPTYLAAPEWQKHHAVIIALAQIAEGCSKLFTSNQLEQVVSMILNSFKDPHPRLQMLNEALVRNESSARESMLKFLIVLAETETFVYKGIDEVVEAMFQIAEAENLEEGTKHLANLEEGTKHLALEFVMLVEKREREPGTINKLSQLVKRLFEVLMKMSDVEDDPDWHRDEIEHEDAGDPTTHQLSEISAILNSEISAILANDQHSEAETLFNLGKQHHPNALVRKLCYLLPVSSQRNRAMCAVLLREILTVDSSSGGGDIYKHLSGDTKSALKQTLIKCVNDETDKSVLKKVCDTVSKLAAIVLPGYGWPMFFSYMFQWVTSDIDRHRESALLIYAQLVLYIGGLLVPRLEKLHQAFLECLDSGMVADVRIAAFTASINFIRYLKEASDRDKFHDLIPLMMQTLNEALVWNESTAWESMLKLLIEWAGTETFVYEGVVEAMLQTAEDENLEEVTKHLALEFLVTLVEAREGAPGMINELPQLVKRLFEVLMKMLSDVEDDPDWYSAEIEHEDAGETNNYIVGQEYLDRLSILLGGNTIFPVISEIFSTYLDAPEWEKHHAALIALAQIAEGCSKVMRRNELEQVVSMILNSFQDPHPRVRWAAINAIGQLSTYRYPHLVLPALASAMDDFHNPRLQAHAASVVFSFSESFTPELLQPYLDGIVEKLLVLLQNPKQMVQEGALTALVLVGGSSQVHFENYYDAVMPYLRGILVNNANDEAKHEL